LIEGLNVTASDINNGPTPFLEEPTLPKQEDFKNPENYEYALNEYKHKLEVYQARLSLHKTCEELTEEELKNVFFIVNQIKHYPTYEDFSPKNDNGESIGFKPALVSEWIANNEKLHFKTDIDTGILYFYNGKSWVPNAEPYLEYIVQKILREENKQGHYTNILHVLRGFTYTETEFSKKIACENGLLDVEKQTLTDFNEKEMPFHQIPVIFNPEVKCPNWEAFISQVVNQDDLLTIQEWSGFLLLPDYRFHKLLWVHGVGRNGKGVWQRTMETILGNNNVAGVGLEEFDGTHRFALKQLYGKLFNTCSEPTTNKELQTPLLKKATGQDTIEAEIKGKQARVPFRNYAKITVLANKFPKVRDQTVAFRERRLFIKFPNEFLGKNQIQNIEDNWLKTNDERSGILNWMLAGLKRLLEQGSFTESRTQQETETQYLRQSDTINAFLTELCVFDKTKTISRSETFEAYKNYCEVLGLDSENDKKFTQRLKETPKINSCVVRNPKMERAWKGIRLKNIDDDGNIIDTPVTDVTLMTCFNPLTIKQKSDNIGGELKSSKSVTTVTTVSNREFLNSQQTCEICGRFHTEGCQHPMCAQGGDPKLIKADSNWAGSCQGFLKKQGEMSNPGVDM
jgi:P4 family phage/plasmid primase-like protien